jgi:hypothetical protein
LETLVECGKLSRQEAPHAIVAFAVAAFVVSDPAAAQSWEEYSSPAGGVTNRSPEQIRVIRNGCPGLNATGNPVQPAAPDDPRFQARR